MKKRIPHLMAFAALLAAEICIGAFVRDNFVRPYVGDMLVTVLLCCLGRVIWPDKVTWLPLWVFFLALGIECTQLIDIPALEGTALGIALGSTFDPVDMLCYGAGCLCFAAAEGFIKHIRK